MAARADPALRMGPDCMHAGRRARPLGATAVDAQSVAAMPLGRDYMHRCGNARQPGCAEVGSQSNAAMPVGREYMQECGNARPSGCAEVGAQSNAAMPMGCGYLPLCHKGRTSGGAAVAAQSVAALSMDRSGAATVAPRRGEEGARGPGWLTDSTVVSTLSAHAGRAPRASRWWLSPAPDSACECSCLLPGGAASRILRGGIRRTS